MQEKYKPGGGILAKVAVFSGHFNGSLKMFDPILALCLSSFCALKSLFILLLFCIWLDLNVYALHSLPLFGTFILSLLSEVCLIELEPFDALASVLMSGTVEVLVAVFGMWSPNLKVELLVLTGCPFLISATVLHIWVSSKSSGSASWQSKSSLRLVSKALALSLFLGTNTGLSLKESSPVSTEVTLTSVETGEESFKETLDVVDFPKAVKEPGLLNDIFAEDSFEVALDVVDKELCLFNVGFAEDSFTEALEVVDKDFPNAIEELCLFNVGFAEDSFTDALDVIDSGFPRAIEELGLLNEGFIPTNPACEAELVQVELVVTQLEIVLVIFCEGTVAGLVFELFIPLAPIEEALTGLFTLPIAEVLPVEIAVEVTPLVQELTTDDELEQAPALLKACESKFKTLFELRVKETLVFTEVTDVELDTFKSVPYVSPDLLFPE